MFQSLEVVASYVRQKRMIMTKTNGEKGAGWDFADDERVLNNYKTHYREHNCRKDKKILLLRRFWKSLSKLGRNLILKFSGYISEYNKVFLCNKENLGSASKRQKSNKKISCLKFELYSSKKTWLTDYCDSLILWRQYF